MAHYAFLDHNNIVTEVIVGKNENSEFRDWEGYYGHMRQQTCKRTSYNTRGGIYFDPVNNLPAADQSQAFRKNYAGVGYSYDPGRDAFIPPKPYASWTLDEFSCTWQAPVAYPNDGQQYQWNESAETWQPLV